MGLREWREKRAKKAERLEISSDINKTSVEAEKRKVKEKYIMANAQEAEKAKDELVELLRELKRTVNNNPKYFQYEKDITSAISFINNGRNLANSNIQFAVDDFIKNKVNECFNYIERDNNEAFYGTLSQITELIHDRNDMSSKLTKYSNKDYRETRAQYDTYMIEKSVLEAKVSGITKQIEKYKEMAHDPKYKTEIKALFDKCKLLDSERTLKQKSINRLIAEITKLRTMLEVLETTISLEENQNRSSSNVDVISKVTAKNEEIKAQSEMEAEAMNELNKSLQDNNVSESSITVSSGTLENESTENETEDILSQFDRF